MNGFVRVVRTFCARLILTAGVVAVAASCGDTPAAPSQADLPPCGPAPLRVTLTTPLACPSKAEIDQLNGELWVIFQPETTEGDLVCRETEGSADLTWVQAQTYLSLLYLRRLRFDQPLPWTPLPIYEWLRQTFQRIIVDFGNMSYYKASVIYIMVPGSTASRPWPLTLGSLSASLYVHEARHGDVGGHPCGNDDNRVSDLGAFGAEYYFYRWIADHSAEPQDVRAWANRAAWEVRSDRFCAECY